MPALRLMNPMHVPHPLRWRRVIALGDYDGVSGASIAACVLSTGAKVAFAETTYYVCSAVGAMDLELQVRTLRVARRYSPASLLVVLGHLDVTGVCTYARTVRTGDPALAGPLAAVGLGLPVLHAFDPDVRRHVHPSVWADNVGHLDQLVETEMLVHTARHVSADGEAHLSTRQGALCCP